MRIIFFGLGSIGQRHARLLQRIGAHELYAFRSAKGKESAKRNETRDAKTKNENKKKNVTNALGIPEVYDWNAVAKLKPDAAFITNPTAQHVETARKCATLGMHLFIEKPLSSSTKGVGELLRLVKRRRLIFYVAYCLRFHPVIKRLARAVKKEGLKGTGAGTSARRTPKTDQPLHVTVTASSYLPDWRPGTDSRQTYSASRKDGGGVILDLSHEIDYLLYLFGPVKRSCVNSRRRSSVTVDAEDFADILLDFENGVPANVHLDFHSRLLKREIVLDYPDKTVVGDLIKGTVTTHAKNGVKVEKFRNERDAMYEAQLAYFFKLLKSKEDYDQNEALDVFTTVLKLRNEVTR